MTDFFKSALGFIGGSSTTKDESDFVGQIVELGTQKLRVKRKIAEGTCMKLWTGLRSDH